MSRENKNENIAAFHRSQILKASETLFTQKGFAQTTVDDISKASGYSRRTIYAYYESKEDILHHIMEKGLTMLKTDIENTIHLNYGFLDQYHKICEAMCKYQRKYPLCVSYINGTNSSDIDRDHASDTIKRILQLGSEINIALAEFIEKGKRDGLVRQDIIPMLTVYVLWSSMTSLLTLTQMKGAWIAEQFSISENEFLDYGFKQLINSILEVRI